MRKNNTYHAAVPLNRNDFIDMVASKEAVIVVNNKILEGITKDVNDSLTSKKTGKYAALSIPLFLLSTNPVGWICSGVVGLCGLLGKAGDDLKRYVAYNGVDTFNNQILVLHRKRAIDLKYDLVYYPDFVKTVDYKKKNKKVKA